MNFIETIAESIWNDIKSFVDNGFKDVKKRNWCIGSDSEFNVYKNLTYKEAYNIYKNLEVRQCFGKKIYEKEFGYTKVESYYTMESNSGHTEIFIFEIDNIIENKSSE